MLAGEALATTDRRPLDKPLDNRTPLGKAAGWWVAQEFPCFHRGQQCWAAFSQLMSPVRSSRCVTPQVAARRHTDLLQCVLNSPQLVEGSSVGSSRPLQFIQEMRRVSGRECRLQVPAVLNP